MKHQANRQPGQRRNVAAWVTLLLFLVMMAVLLGSTARLAQSAGEEGVAAVRDAIERATVLCYATEGFYPPQLSYIEEHYGVAIDHTRYAVRYEAYASNVMPGIYVVPR